MQRAAAVATGRVGARAEAGPPAARLGRFVVERFPPATYGLLIAALVLCGAAAASLDRGQTLAIGWSQAWAAIAAWLTFLQLRALDELRDEAADRQGRPDRPLPRGLVSRGEVRALAVGAAVAGGAIAALLGPAALACYALAIGQVWLLGLGDERRPPVLRGTVATALTHSGIVPAVLLVAWATVAVPGVSGPLAATLLLVWGAGLVLEIGRKIVTPGEERPGIATYSASLGRPRALRLAALFVTLMGSGAALLALAAGASVAVTAVPLTAAAGTSVALAWAGKRVGTRAIRAGLPLLVLAALVWPVLLAGGLR